MAAEGGFVVDLSFSAGSTLSSNQFYIVKSTEQNVIGLAVNASGGGVRAKGVLQNDPGNGQAATVRVLGYTKVVAGGTIAAGAPLTTSTAGTALSAGTTGEFVWGWANSASTAAGQVIEAFVCPSGLYMGSTA
jgi:hypothetical protein